MHHLDYTPTRAQISRAAIQRLHVAMRHLFMRGGYKPLGVSGETMINSMLELKPEIYGSIADKERVELIGLHYIFQRLPLGIESCRYFKLISREGFEESDFEPIIPSKRRRNCYKVDEEQIFIEMTRGRSDIYDVLTHLTFMFIESQKILNNGIDAKGRKKRAWIMLEKLVADLDAGVKIERQVGYTYLSTLLGRTFDETADACKKFDESEGVNSLFHVTYWLGRRAMEEELEGVDREINFSSALRQVLGHHLYGELWANQIKAKLIEKGLFNKEIHILSSNLHSVMNVLYADSAINTKKKYNTIEEMALDLSLPKNQNLRDKVKNYALKNGMTELWDNNGTNIGVQIFDCEQINMTYLKRVCPNLDDCSNKVVIVMDYAFGQQAYETIDELLKPYVNANEKLYLNVASINVMGKAGILEGKKGDIMIPTAHIFEGSADNYPVNNDLCKKDFVDKNIDVYEGPMITVLGTSLQNKDILRYFHKSSWSAIGLEMEGAHYQKAIQAAAKIRNNISDKVITRYAYYASDNPLVTGSTLASGSLGEEGVKPTYMITLALMKGIFSK